MFDFARLYVALTVSQIGNWLTFLAVGLILKEAYGGAHVAYGFLIQSLPAVILSRSLGGLIPERRVHLFFLISQLSLALLLLPLALGTGMVGIYAILLFSACIKAVAVPLQNALIGQWVKKEDLTIAHTRVGSLQAATLAFAPALGGLITVQFGARALFAIDALTFVIAAVLLWIPSRSGPIQLGVSSEPKPRIAPLRDFFLTFSPRPREIPDSVAQALKPWFGFLVIGALLNGLEFAVFERDGFTSIEIGQTLAAWGVGALIALFVPKHRVQSLSPFGLALVHLFGLSLFCFVGGFAGAVTSFLLSGLATSLLSGLLRAKVQGSVPAGFNALPVWGYSNQMLSIINVVLYGSLASLLGWIGVSGVSMVLLVTVLAWAVSVWRSESADGYTSAG